MPLIVDAALALSATGLALALRPWRALPTGGPPWPWLAWSLMLPLWWSVDRLSAAPLAQPLSGACLLLLMAGWPLAVLLLLPVAGLTMVLAGLDAAQALHRLVWLGLAPATLAMLLGAAVRHGLPRHLFVFILGRGFFVSALAYCGAALGQWALAGHPPGLQAQDWLLARVLTASGDAFIVGMLAAIFVAFRPRWLATYTDRLYLPGQRGPGDRDTP
jgi:uncharacterized membrane protein